jgi:hypothetical protein
VLQKGACPNPSLCIHFLLQRFVAANFSCYHDERTCLRLPVFRHRNGAARPILGVTEAYNADQNPAKTNLGVGVYYDDNGKVPLLECVKKAEAELAAKLAPRTYLPIDGLATYDRAVQELVFGAGSAVVTESVRSPCKPWAAPAP